MKPVLEKLREAAVALGPWYSITLRLTHDASGVYTEQVSIESTVNGFVLARASGENLGNVLEALAVGAPRTRRAGATDRNKETALASARALNRLLLPGTGTVDGWAGAVKGSRVVKDLSPEQRTFRDELDTLLKKLEWVLGYNTD